MQITKEIMETILWIAFIVAYLVLEINYQRAVKKSFAIDALIKPLQAIIHFGKEMCSNEGARVLCGSVAILIVLVSVVLLIHALNCAFTQPAAFENIILCGLGVLFFGPATLLWLWVNRRFIARA